MNIACVLTAAGCASRFGADKLMYEFHGIPILEHVLRAVSAAPFCSRTAVVSCADGQAAKLAASYGFRIAVNSQTALGLSESVRIGTNTVRDGVDGILFSVGDQPLLSTKTICRMLDIWQNDTSRIVALGRNGIRGNPVIFPSAFFDALTVLSGDMGGSRIIAANAERLVLVDPFDPCELEDIDTKKDWEQLC